MGKRDFTNESLINFLRRLVNAFLIRIRGYFFGISFSGVSKSPKGLKIGRRPRLINSKGIVLGKGIVIGNYARIESYNLDKEVSTRIFIDDKTSFGDFLHIGSINKITIGKGVLGGAGILIIDHDHGRVSGHLKNYENIPPIERELVSKGEIIIEDNVWLGDRAIILAGSKIGKGSVIGAGCIVNGNLEPFSVYVGKKG